MQNPSTVHRKRFLSISSFPPIFLQRYGCERGVDDDGKEDEINGNESGDEHEDEDDEATEDCNRKGLQWEMRL